MPLEPAISVIVPCYDVAPWVNRCLDSVSAALPDASEILAVDDGSTDETLSILRARTRTESRLHVLSVPHGGVSAARNAGLDRARGRFVFFVDPDDTVEPDFFSALTDATDREHADCCICGYRECDEHAVPVRDIPLKADYRLNSNARIVEGFLPRIFGYSHDDIRAWYAGRPLFADREMAYSWRLCFRRATIERARLRFAPALELNEDALFNAEFLLAAESMTCVNRPLYRSTARADGAVKTISRDGSRYCRNKLELYRQRERLAARYGASLRRLYAASCVLSALEIGSLVLRCKVRPAEGLAILREYVRTPSFDATLAGFPVSPRHPFLALAVGMLRLTTRSARQA